MQRPSIPVYNDGRSGPGQIKQISSMHFEMEIAGSLFLLWKWTTANEEPAICDNKRAYRNIFPDFQPRIEDYTLYRHLAEIISAL